MFWRYVFFFFYRRNLQYWIVFYVWDVCLCQTASIWLDQVKQHPGGFTANRTPRMDQWVSKTGNNAKCSAIIAVSTTGSSCQSCHSFLHRSHPGCIPFNLHRIRQIGMLVKVPEVIPSGLVKHGVPLGNPRTSRGVSHRKLIKLNEVLSGVMVDYRRVS